MDQNSFFSECLNSYQNTVERRAKIINYQLRTAVQNVHSLTIQSQLPGRLMLTILIAVVERSPVRRKGRLQKSELRAPVKPQHSISRNMRIQPFLLAPRP